MVKNMYDESFVDCLLLFLAVVNRYIARFIGSERFPPEMLKLLAEKIR